MNETIIATAAPLNQRQPAIEALLAEALGREGRLRGVLPDGMRAQLEADQSALARRLLHELVAWKEEGGGFPLAPVAPLPAPTPIPAPPSAAAPVAAPVDAAATAEIAPVAAPVAEAPPAEPPPAETAPAPSTPPVANSAAIAALKSHLENGGRFGSGGLTRIDWRVRFTNIMNELTDSRSAEDESRDLVRIIDSRQTWPSLPGHVQVAIISYLAARTRHIQERGEDLRLDAAVRRLSAYQRDYNPGFVWGLARTHEPRRASWSEEGEFFWAELQSLLPGNEPEAIRKPAPPVHRKAPEPDEDDEEDVSPIPVDWEWWGRTRGKRAVMVGGDPREPNRLRLEAAFGFSELVWERAERTRNNLQMIRERVKSGKLDMVVVLTRFVGHDADHVIQPACKEMGVPFVPVQSGYGVQGVRRSIERFLSPQGYGPSPDKAK